nr:putative ribonuclease H-like domain-containing protein [Tanacetum cinerariifolium]
PVKTSIPSAAPKPTCPKSTNSGKRRNRKTCFVCKSVDHLIKDCDYHAKKMAQPTPRLYTHRGKNKRNASLTNKNPPKHMVPAAVLTQSKPVSITAVRLVSTDVPKIMVTRPRLAHPIITKSKSPIRRHITRSQSPKTSNLPPRVTVVQAPVVNVAQGMKGKWVWRPKCLIQDHDSRTTSASMTLKRFDYNDALGRSKLHMDLFGPTFVKSLNKKSYCIVVTDDYSRFASTIPFWAEAVNTACYVQNRVLATKPHKKTPYELLHGRPPSIGFMRPFGCPVTILNTLYSLGKFKGKVDEGFLVGYSNYDGDVAFDGKEHDIDGKKPQSEVILSPSNSAQSKKQDDKTKKEAKGKSPVESFTGYRDLVKSLKIALRTAVMRIGGIAYFDDENNVGAEADFNNLETSIKVSHIPTTRIHKDHLVSQIIGDLSSTTQTRSMTTMVKDQGGLSHMFNDDFHTCMFACFLLQEEPKRVHQAFKDPSWIEAMQEELLQFKMQKVWILVDLPHGKEPLVPNGFTGIKRMKEALWSGTKFEDPDHPDKVYKVVKALYGLHQAPRAWYETLANYLQENGFQRGKIDQTLFIKKQKGDILLVQIYVDDIIFGATNKDLCKSFEKLMKDKFQMSSMGELTFFLGLQVKQKKDGIFISRDKYVAEILRKFGLTEGKSASTPIDTEKPLLKDPDGEDVDVHTYRSMISSLMYLTSSRLDIMFAVCACARFQVTPKASHLHVVKRIFRYLKGKPHLGLWYPKDSPFDLVAYSDCDYDGASLDRKSTTKGCQFLGCRLISWQCKKQTVVATSSTEAEYVATFWNIVFIKQANDVTRLQALVDKKKVVVTEAAIREVLRLDDAEKQVGDLSIHTTKYASPTLTHKVFANMRRVGKGFSGVKTPLFEGMLVRQKIKEDEIKKSMLKMLLLVMLLKEMILLLMEKFLLSLTNHPYHLLLHLLHHQNHLKISHQHPRRVEHLKYDKVAQALEITKRKRRVKKLEKGNRVRVLKLRRLKRVGTSQRIDTFDDTVLDDESNQGKIIDEMDKDDVVALMDDKEEDKKDEEAKVVENNQEDEPAEVQEVVDVVTTAKLITKVVTGASKTVTAASSIISAAETQVPAAIITASCFILLFTLSHQIKNPNNLPLFDDDKTNKVSCELPFK